MKTMVFGALFLFFFCFSAHAENAVKKVRVGLGFSKPPFIIQSENRGLEYDIIKEAFENVGYEMLPSYLPLSRIAHQLRAGKLDAASNVRPSMMPGMFFSQKMLFHENYAISRLEDQITINSKADLRGHSIVAFQNAHKFLGDDYREMSEQNGNYYEVADQASQLKMLANGRVKIAIMDYKIFQYFNNQSLEGERLKATLHDIFDPTSYGLAFSDPKIRDLFNKGLSQLIQTGQIKKIYGRYSLEYKR